MVRVKRLILLPGLAADERMYQHVTDLPIPLLTPRLLVPYPDENMVDYARRHASWLDISEDDVIGGCSFGSMVASEICRQRSTRALILLSGALTSASLAETAQKAKVVSRFIPFAIARRLLMSSTFLHAVFGAADADKIALARQMIYDTPRDLLLRGSNLAAGYLSQQEIKCRVFALHGGQDRVLAAPAVDQCEIIADAGHGMVVSHPQQVGEFLHRVLAQL